MVDLYFLIPKLVTYTGCLKKVRCRKITIFYKWCNITMKYFETLLIQLSPTRVRSFNSIMLKVTIKLCIREERWVKRGLDDLIHVFMFVVLSSESHLTHHSSYVLNFKYD